MSELHQNHILIFENTFFLWGISSLSSKNRGLGLNTSWRVSTKVLSTLYVCMYVKNFQRGSLGHWELHFTATWRNSYIYSLYPKKIILLLLECPSSIVLKILFSFFYMSRMSRIISMGGLCKLSNTFVIKLVQCCPMTLTIYIFSYTDSKYNMYSVTYIKYLHIFKANFQMRCGAPV